MDIKAFDEVPEMPLQSKRDFIFQLPIFRGIRQLPTKQGGDGSPRQRFLDICKEFAFEAGAVIAEQGDLADSLFIVMSGRVRALDVSFNERNEQVFRPVPDQVYGPGEWFHDAWLFRPATHPYLIQAVRPGRILQIRSGDFIKYLKAYPSTLQYIFPHLSPEAQQIVRQSRFQDYMRQPLWSGLVGKREGAARVSRPSRRGRRTAPEESGIQLSPNQLAQIRKLDLLPEEYVEFFARRSSKILAFRTSLDLFLAAIFFLLPFWLLLGAGAGWNMAVIVGAILGAIPLFDILFYWINWQNCYFVITNRRLVRYQLLIFRFQTRIERVDIEKVQTINVKKDNPINNYLRIGTAEITTAAQSTVLYFDAIDRPERVENILEKIRQQEKEMGASRIRAAMRETVDKHFGLSKPLNKIEEPPPPPPPKSLFERIQEGLIQAEKEGSIIYHKHPIALLRHLLWPGIFALILLVTLYPIYTFSDLINGSVMAVYVFLWIGLLIWGWWQFEDWRNDTYQITDRYIYDVDRKPLGFGENRKVAELNRVENVRTEQDGFMQTVFNYGNVQVETAGVDSNIVFENVRNPRGVQNQIFAKRDKYRQKQEEADKARRLDQTTTLIEMFEERRARGLLPRYRPLPESEEDDLD